MNKAILTPGITQALSRGGVIDITTNGAKSGKPRRIEIVAKAWKRKDLEDMVATSPLIEVTLEGAAAES